MASGGSYTLKDGEPVLTERSGHVITPSPNLESPAPAAKKKVKTNEDTQKSTTGRG